MCVCSEQERTWILFHQPWDVWPRMGVKSWSGILKGGIKRWQGRPPAEALLCLVYWKSDGLSPVLGTWKN